MLKFVAATLMKQPPSPLWRGVGGGPEAPDESQFSISDGPARKGDAAGRYQGAGTS